MQIEIFLQKNEKKCENICTYQKKAVPLHPLLKKALPNRISVVHQILVLRGEVRLLVRQQRRRRSPFL